MAREGEKGEKGEFATFVHPLIIMPKSWIVRPGCRRIYRNLGCGLCVGIEFKGMNGCDELTLLTSTHHSITVYVCDNASAGITPCCGILEAFSPRVEKASSFEWICRIGRQGKTALHILILQLGKNFLLTFFNLGG